MQQTTNASICLTKNLRLDKMFTWKTFVLGALDLPCPHTGTCVTAISLLKRSAWFVSFAKMSTSYQHKDNSLVEEKSVMLFPKIQFQTIFFSYIV